MYPIRRGFPQTDRIYEEIIYLVNNDDENFTSNSLIDIEGSPISRRFALGYIEQAFKVSNNQHIEVSKDAAVKKFPNSAEILDDNVIEMKPFIGNTYNLLPSTSMVGNIIGHASLIRTLLRHELHQINLPYFQWTKFEFLPRVLITIHAEYYKIDEINASFAKWMAYSEVHENQPLNLDVFSNLLDILVHENEEDEKDKNKGKQKIKKVLSKINPFKKKKQDVGNKELIIGDQLNTNDVEVEKLFCDFKRFLLNSFLVFMRNIHGNGTATDQDEDDGVNAAQHAVKATTFNKMLEIINRLEKIYLNDGFSKVLPNITDLHKQMIKNFEDGTVEHLNGNIDKGLLSLNDQNEKRLTELIKMIRLAVDHREKFVACFDQDFRSFSDISISKRMYEIYDTQFAILVKPIILQICKNKSNNDDNDDDYIQKEEAVIKKLFELYRELEMFVNYGKQHFVDNKFETTQFYSWFAPGVDKFFKFFEFHAKSRITKAVESDHVVSDSDTTKMSPSIIDTVQTLFAIKRNWDVLIGLTKNKEATILKKIVEQFCSFSKMYFETFLDKAKVNLDCKDFEMLTIPLELSVAVANFNYFTENFKTLIDELTRDKVTDKMAINKQFENNQQNLKCMVHKFIEYAIQELVPTIKQQLYEDTDESRGFVGRSLTNSIELMLITFSDEFADREFKKSRLILWQNVIKTLEKTVQFGLKHKKSPNFFSNLYKVFEDLKGSFRYVSDPNFIEDVATTRKVKNLDQVLQRNRFSISELICQYYSSRHESQEQFKADGVSFYGNLTVKCFIYQNVLTIEILKPENLVPIDENGIRCPYVKILMIPKENFGKSSKIKWQNKENGNLVASKRNVTLKMDINSDESYIHFKVKDEESMLLKLRSILASLNCFDCRSPEERNSRFLGEAFMSFRDIPTVTQGNGTHEIELTLTKLQSCDLESLKAINQSAKAGNKQAIKFLKSLENNSHIKLQFNEEQNNDTNI